MALKLTKGEPVGTPASGDQMLATDGTGAAYLLNSDGTRSLLGSSGAESDALAWLATTADFIATKDATLVKIPFWTYGGLLGGAVERGAVSGSGSAYQVRITGSNSLKLRTSSGATGNSFQAFRNRVRAIAAAASTFDDLVANCRTTRFAVAVKCIVRAVNNTCQLNLCNMTDEATADFSLGVQGATSQVNFSLKIGAAAAIDTGVAIGTLGTTEHTLILVSDGTTGSAFIDYAVAAVASGPSNTAANAAGHVTSNAFNGATTTNVEHDILYWAAFVA